MDGGAASGQTAAPLVGAAVGIAAAVALCWLLYRRAVRLNVGVFFNRTAIALIVIAAGVLAYGLGDLQDAGLLPGHAWIAFDLTAHIDPGSWWASIITGITELSPKMTVLQVIAWLAYLAVVIPAFVTRRAGRKPAAAAALPGSRAAARSRPPGTPRRPAVGAPRRTAAVGGGRGPRRGARRWRPGRRSPRCPRRPPPRRSAGDRDENRLRARVDRRRTAGTQTFTVQPTTPAWPARSTSTTRPARSSVRSRRSALARRAPLTATLGAARTPSSA